MKETIAVVCSDITQLGGIERVVCNFSKNLIEFGKYNIIIISINSSGGLPFYNLSPEVKLIHLGVENSISLLKRCFSYRDVIEKVTGICCKNNVNIIMGTDTRIGVMLYFVKKEKLIKIACEHNNYDTVTFYTSLARRFFYPKLNAVVLLSKRDAENYNFCKNTRVIPNSLPFNAKRFSDLTCNMVISAGRLEKVKGFDILIEAVFLIKDKCAGWKFKIVGEGNEKKTLIKLIARRRVDDIIEIMSATENMEREYCNASIYVLSSKKESFGLVLLEAKSCGLPVISFDCPNGPADIVRNGIDGILVENGNVEALSQAILKLIENPQLRQQYGREAIRDVERFSPKRIFEMWDKLFTDSIKEQ